MENLPDEVMMHLFELTVSAAPRNELELPDTFEGEQRARNILRVLAGVCQRWRRLARDASLWRLNWVGIDAAMRILLPHGFGGLHVLVPHQRKLSTNEVALLTRDAETTAPQVVRLQHWESDYAFVTDFDVGRITPLTRCPAFAPAKPYRRMVRVRSTFDRNPNVLVTQLPARDLIELREAIWDHSSRSRAWMRQATALRVLACSVTARNWLFLLTYLPPTLEELSVRGLPSWYVSRSSIAAARDTDEATEPEDAHEPTLLPALRTVTMTGDNLGLRYLSSIAPHVTRVSCQTPDEIADTHWRTLWSLTLASAESVNAAALREMSIEELRLPVCTVPEDFPWPQDVTSVHFDQELELLKRRFGENDVFHVAHLPRLPRSIDSVWVHNALASSIQRLDGTRGPPPGWRIALERANFEYRTVTTHFARDKLHSMYE